MRLMTVLSIFEDDTHVYNKLSWVIDTKLLDKDLSWLHLSNYVRAISA